MTDAASFAERLALMPPEVREEALRQLGEERCAQLRHQWRGFWARPNQLAPEGDWLVWLILAGRGWGKTRTGAQWVREEVEAGRATRIALIGETHKDLEEVMVFGDSGLANIWPKHQRPTITKRPIKITFHNGAQAFGYNATEPEQLRGPQFDLAWCDELAKWRYAQETWDQLQFGLRLGQRPRVCVTTTPRPTPIIRDMLKRYVSANDAAEFAAGNSIAYDLANGGRPDVIVTRGRTLDNRGNLAPTFLRAIVEKYGNTRLGRQELEAEILDDVPGAFWTRKMLDDGRIRPEHLPPLKRIVVAVDPAASSEETSDEPGENGIVAAGLGQNGRGYVLDDASLIGSPHEWASRAVSTLDRFEGDAVVVEENMGGDMVEHVLRSVRPTLKIIRVRATRGKHVRAEPIAALYEQGRVSHLGTFAALEDQMVLVTAQGFLGKRSPDRLDALVWAMTELFPAMIKPEPKPVVKRPARPVGGGLGWMR